MPARPRIVSVGCYSEHLLIIHSRIFRLRLVKPPLAAQLESAVPSGQKVVLEGKVHSWSERYKVENAAWSAPGVKAVVDHLQVG